MAVIVIVHRQREVAAQYALWLEGQGHAFFCCCGPTSPDYQCPILHAEPCPLWEAGQLFIYDPWLDVDRDKANSEELVLALRRRYPTKPLLLIGPSLITPTWVERIVRQDPLVRAVFPQEPEALRAAVNALLGPGERGSVQNDPMAAYGPEPGIESALLAQERIWRLRSAKR